MKEKQKGSIYDKLNIIFNYFNLDIISGINIINAKDSLLCRLNKRQDTIVINCGIDNIIQVSEQIVEYYGDSKKVYCLDFDESNVLKSTEVYSNKIQKCDSLYIPKEQEDNLMGKTRDIYDLIELVNILRGENGCPWDREQNHKSIENSLIEEAYEVVDAIENDNIQGLQEELGDVLFQIIFHLSLEQGNNTFGLNDIIQGIYDKMVYRHPHVFGSISASNTEEVLKNWDVLKNKEKSLISKKQELDAIAKGFPALVRANKVQKKVSKVGFDFKDAEEASIKIDEEIKEIKEVYKTGNMARITEEVGDLLFSVVNVARHLNVDPEEALRKTTEKFIARFEYIEKNAISSNKKLSDLSLDQMNYLWQKAKNIEK